ncbi:MAG: response regulator transcription factor [Planctomycetaceae bacterium]|nr:response regulator transcription factor [Planctomycetaceae bacterium]
MVFDYYGQPVFPSDALRSKLASNVSLEGSNHTESLVWQAACERAGRMVSEAIRNGSQHGVSALIAVGQRCFALIGSLIRNSATMPVGAVIHLSDVTPDATRLAAAGDLPGQPQAPKMSEEQQDEIAELWKQREIARQKIGRLSRREYQVVSLVADGLPNKSIAHELDISVKTIEKHRANATRKLGVDSTAEVVRIAVIADSKPTEVDRTSELPGRSETPFFPRPLSPESQN